MISHITSFAQENSIKGIQNAPHPFVHFNTGVQKLGGDIGRSQPDRTFREGTPGGDKSDLKIWQGLIAEHCARRDKTRLRECLDGLRGDGTLSQGDRRGIWRSLSPECRSMCQVVAGGAE